jgi:hypothetical protein
VPLGRSALVGSGLARWGDCMREAGNVRTCCLGAPNCLGRRVGYGDIRIHRMEYAWQIIAFF